MVRVRIFVSGTVQGVFFRQSTEEKARNLNILGWVRNLKDGRVEAVFEGKKEDVEKMKNWMKKGPTLAKVENIEILWENYKKEFKDLRVL